MTTLTETLKAGHYIVSEANGRRSRETVTLISGQNLKAGTVLGKITASGKYTQHDKDALDGSEVALAVLFDDVDASGGDKTAVITARDSEVNAAELTWPAGYVANDITAATVALNAVGIVAR